MNISVESLKALREKTQAGMLDCRKALAEAAGNLEDAEKLIMEWGLAQATKRADKATPEGRVGLMASKQCATLVALSCETDFVAKNEQFISVTNAIAEKFHHATTERLAEAEVSALELVKDLERRMKERILLSGHAKLEAGPGEYLDAYLHGEGTIGAAVRVRIEPYPAMEDLAADLASGIHDLCLQIAAGEPEYVSKQSVPGEVLKKLEEEFAEEVESDPDLRGKPLKVLAGIVGGKLAKKLSRLCLLEQRFIKDETKTVARHVEEIEKKAGVRLEITGFARLALGS